jgi:uncharacterized repeat protein (TIGR01451 family)
MASRKYGLYQNRGRESVGTGENVTCAFTNAKLAQLTVIKNVINDNGGSKQITDFPLFVNGESVTSNATNPYLPSGYNVSESTDSAYTAAFSGDCDGAGNVTLSYGDNKTCIITNNDIQPKLTVTKIVGPGGLAVISDFTLKANETTVTSGIKTGFNVGAYTISETPNANGTGYTGAITCEGQATNSITLALGDDKSCTITNIRDTGTVVVHKDVQGPNGEDVTDTSTNNFQVSLNDSNAQNITDNGIITYTNVPTGIHKITESYVSPNYTFYSITPDSDTQTSGAQITVSKNSTTDVYVTNRQKTGAVAGYKFNDVNGNGIRDCELFNDERTSDNGFCTNYTEPTLSGWTIFIDSDSDGKLDNEEQSTITGSDGTYTLSGLNPGDYRICEVTQAGWEQTYPTDPETNNCYFVAVHSNKLSPGYDFGNHNLIPKLLISKSNDASGNKAPGDVVNFTITINNDPEAGQANNVKVVDLLPKGFKYNSGSWKAVLNDTIDLPVAEPVYASPGTWILPNIKTGDKITLTYSATIDNGQQTGTYYDNAWAQGTPVSDSSNIILAMADPAIGNIGDANFVGTQVAVVNGNLAGVDYKVTSTQSVLGASTGPELPSTGENTLWVIMATLFMSLGLGSLVLGIRLRRRYE